MLSKVFSEWKIYWFVIYVVFMVLQKPIATITRRVWIKYVKQLYFVKVTNGVIQLLQVRSIFNKNWTLISFPDSWFRRQECKQCHLDFQNVYIKGEVRKRESLWAFERVKFRSNDPLWVFPFSTPSDLSKLSVLTPDTCK